MHNVFGLDWHIYSGCLLAFARRCSLLKFPSPFFFFVFLEAFNITNMLLSFYSHPIISLFLLVALPCLYFLISCIYERVSIRRLGTLSPRVPSYLPFGLDVVYRSVRLSLSNLDLEFWHWLFRYRTHPRSYTVESSLGGQRFIFTADPENIKAILAIKFQDYGKGKQFHSEWEDFLGDSIFTTDGDLWHASRHLIRPQFVKERVKELDIFEEHVQKVIRQLGGQGQEVNIAALFYRFTLDSTTDYLLGHSVGSLDSPQSEFSEAFNYVQKIQSLVARMGLFNRFIPRRTFWRSLEAINAFVEPFIDQVLRMNIQDLKYMSNQSFLQALAATGTRDRKIIRDQVMAVLLAGRDTTAGTLSFLFLELSQHPEVLVKLRQEILNAVGGEERPTYEDLKNMPYLQQTMNEVLRLYPSVPYNVSD